MTRDEILNTSYSFGYGGMYKIELETLYDLSKDKICIEVGSFVGQSSYIMASQAKKLICIDLWHFDKQFNFLTDENSRKHYFGIYDELTQNNPKQIFTLFKERLSPFVNKLITIVEDSKTAYRYINDNIADLILLDGDHSFFGTFIDYSNYIDKLKINGLLCFHDNGNLGWPGVKQAVDKILEKDSIILEKQVETLSICRKVK